MHVFSLARAWRQLGNRGRLAVEAVGQATVLSVEARWRNALRFSALRWTTLDGG
jgi:hypothetical protein